jgi:hypothetical protein
LVLVVLLQDPSKGSPRLAVLHVPLKVGLECENRLVIIAGIDELKGEFLWECDILKRVVRVEHILCFNLSVDKLFLEVS